jgi:hypothetical protein
MKKSTTTALKVVGTVNCTELYLVKKRFVSVATGKEGVTKFTHTQDGVSFELTGESKGKVWSATGDVKLLQEIFATNFVPAGKQPKLIGEIIPTATPIEQPKAKAAKPAKEAEIKPAAKAEPTPAPVATEKAKPAAKKAEKAPEVKAEVAPTPAPKTEVAKAKRTAISDTSAILAELGLVLNHKSIKKMEVKCGKGTVAVKAKEEGKPARNVFTINEVYRLPNGELVMALNTNSLPFADTKLPEGMEAKAHKTYFKRSGLNVATVAEIVKLNF